MACRKHSLSIKKTLTMTTIASREQESIDLTTSLLWMRWQTCELRFLHAANWRSTLAENYRQALETARSVCFDVGLDTPAWNYLIGNLSEIMAFSALSEDEKFDVVRLTLQLKRRDPQLLKDLVDDLK